jgi:hypothetical protein
VLPCANRLPARTEGIPVTSRTVSNHVLEILLKLKGTRQLSDEEVLRFSVELHRIVEGIRCGCVVLRNPASTDGEIVVDDYIKNLRQQDVVADPNPTLYVQIVGGHEASLRN